MRNSGLRLDDLVDRRELQVGSILWATHAQFSNASSPIEDGKEKGVFDAGRLHFSIRGFGFTTKRGPR